VALKVLFDVLSEIVISAKVSVVNIGGD